MARRGRRSGAVAADTGALGKRLRALRVAKGASQAELAQAQYTHAYVSTIESGKRHPSLEAIGPFAARLGVEIEDLARVRGAHEAR